MLRLVSTSKPMVSGRLPSVEKYSISFFLPSSRTSKSLRVKSFTIFPSRSRTVASRFTTRTSAEKVALGVESCAHSVPMASQAEIQSRIRLRRVQYALRMRFLLGFLIAAAALAAENVSTFSIVAYDAQAGDWGVAVASRYFSVGSVVPWAEAGVGAIATQANVNVGYGPRGLELLRQGLTAKQTLDKLLAEDTFDGKDGRQVAIIDGKGNIAAFTGPNAPDWAGDRQGKTWSAQGNILVGPQVVEAMGKAFESTSGELAEKMYAALKAGDAAGGDARGKQSASMLVVRKQGGRNINNDRYIYINVDDNPQPFPELRRLLDMNLGYLYQDKTFKLLRSGNTK